MDESVVDVGSQTPVSTVQVNSYCAHCNYNLYSQKVCRDDRLGILVCRCPECGRFTAAGAMSTANQKLMERFATLGIVIYIGFMLGGLAIFSSVLAGVQGSFLHERYWIDFPPPDTNNLYHYVRNTDSLWPSLIGGAICGSMMGGFFAIFCWHWRRGLRFLAAVVPIPLAMLVWYNWYVPNYGMGKVVQRGDLLGWGIHWLSVIAGIQILSIIVGELTGRLIGRFVLRILVPSSLLQYLSFLWFVDGKQPPPPRNVSAQSSVSTQTAGRTVFPLPAGRSV